MYDVQGLVYGVHWTCKMSIGMCDVQGLKYDVQGFVYVDHWSCVMSKCYVMIATGHVCPRVSICWPWAIYDVHLLVLDVHWAGLLFKSLHIMAIGHVLCPIVSL